MVCVCGCGCVCVAGVGGWGWRHFSNYLYDAAPRGRCNETSPCKTPVSGMLCTPLHFSCTVWSHSMCKAASVGNIFAEVGRSQPQTKHKWDIASFPNSSNQLNIICFIGFRCLKWICGTDASGLLQRLVATFQVHYLEPQIITNPHYHWITATKMSEISAPLPKVWAWLMEYSVGHIAPLKAVGILLLNKSSIA